eukprot:TRINITY_DN7693_c0_g1_i1.p1 TRINITY_DN7693_c0_g1~~TRINITY_DN7693_c0_g1_i1.p1  ORF type:complete len:379 (-),score=26.59 TRINITY_DN7693_c0_g1_i1:88-1224(-)
MYPMLTVEPSFTAPGKEITVSWNFTGHEDDVSVNDLIVFYPFCDDLPLYFDPCCAYNATGKVVDSLVITLPAADSTDFRNQRRFESFWAEKGDSTCHICEVRYLLKGKYDVLGGIPLKLGSHKAYFTGATSSSDPENPSTLTVFTPALLNAILVLLDTDSLFSFYCTSKVYRDHVAKEKLFHITARSNYGTFLMESSSYVQGCKANFVAPKFHIKLCKLLAWVNTTHDGNWFSRVHFVPFNSVVKRKQSEQIISFVAETCNGLTIDYDKTDNYFLEYTPYRRKLLQSLRTLWVMGPNERFRNLELKRTVKFLVKVLMLGAGRRQHEDWNTRSFFYDKSNFHNVPKETFYHQSWGNGWTSVFITSNSAGFQLFYISCDL